MAMPGRRPLPAIYNNYEMTCVMNPVNLLHTKRKPTDPLIRFLAGPKVSPWKGKGLKNSLEKHPKSELEEFRTCQSCSKFLTELSFGILVRSGGELSKTISPA